MPDDDQGVDMGRMPSETAVAIVETRRWPHRPFCLSEIRRLLYTGPPAPLERGCQGHRESRTFYSGGLVPRSGPEVSVLRRGSERMLPRRRETATSQTNAVTTVNVTVNIGELTAVLDSVGEEIGRMAVRRLRALDLVEIALAGDAPAGATRARPKYPPALLEPFIHDGWALQVLASRKAIRRHGTVVGNCLGGTGQSKNHFDAVRDGVIGAIVAMTGPLGAGATAAASRTFDRFYCELSDYDQRSGDWQAIGGALAAFAAFAQAALDLPETDAILLSRPQALTPQPDRRVCHQVIVPIWRRAPDRPAGIAAGALKPSPMDPGPPAAEITQGRGLPGPAS